MYQPHKKLRSSLSWLKPKEENIQKVAVKEPPKEKDEKTLAKGIIKPDNSNKVQIPPKTANEKIKTFINFKI